MNAPQPRAQLDAQWFDGRSSRARPAQMRLVASPNGTRLQLRAQDGAGETLDLAHKQVGWPERWSAGRAPPRVAVDLGAHGSLQIDDVAGWQAALAQAGHRSSLAERMQTRWSVLLAVLLIAGAGVWAFYRWGTPWAATQITRHVPLAWELALTEQAMQQIDADYVKPSKLPPERQAELRAGFDKLVALIGPDLQRYRGYRPPFKLEFRSGMGPNAFALPGGTIVMTDAMVEQARTIPNTGDTALLGVLAHEIGHVEHRHTTRMVVEQGVLHRRLAAHRPVVPAQPRDRIRLLRRRHDEKSRSAHGADGRSAAGGGTPDGRQDAAARQVRWRQRAGQNTGTHRAQASGRLVQHAS